MSSRLQFRSPLNLTKERKRKMPIKARHDTSLNLAIEGRQVLASYVAKRLQDAGDRDNLQDVAYYNALAGLLANDSIGITLGSLVFEMADIIEEYSREVEAASSDTAKIPNVWMPPIN